MVLDRVPAGGGRRDRRPPVRDARRAGPRRGAAVRAARRPGSTARGCCPRAVTAPLADWFARLAADADARAAVVRQTLDGALAALHPAVERAGRRRRRAGRRRRRAGRAGPRPPTGARSRTVEQGLQDGRLLRGEVLARWQEFVGTGEFFRTLEARIGRLRDRVVAAVTGRPAPAAELRNAIESQLVTLLRGVAAEAAENAYTAWKAHPAGAALLDPALAHPADRPARARRAAGPRLAARRAGAGPGRGRRQALRGPHGARTR